MAKVSGNNRYVAIVEHIFYSAYQAGQRDVAFEREDLVKSAAKLGVERPRNLGDLIYTFRYRQELPDSILNTAPDGETWIIRSAGTSRYRFVLVTDAPLTPNPNLAVTKVPDATPGIIARNAFSDEQAVLALVRCNRLIDIFLGIPVNHRMVCGDWLASIAGRTSPSLTGREAPLSNFGWSHVIAACSRRFLSPNRRNRPM